MEAQQKSASSWSEAEVTLGSDVETLQGQDQLPVGTPKKPRKRNLMAEGFVFPVSLLFTADAHQETMEMFWFYG